MTGRRAARNSLLPAGLVLASVFFLATSHSGSANRAIRRAVSVPHDTRAILVRRKSATVDNAPRFRGARLAPLAKAVDTPAPHARRERFEKFELPEGVSVADALEDIAATQPDLEAVPDIRVHAFRTPNDPLYPQSWALKNSAQTVSAIAPFPLQTGNPGTSGLDIGAESAWDFQSDCSSIVVAVIDTGVTYDHADLAANMWVSSNPSYPNHGYDYFDNDNDPRDLDGHGTHVAAIIGAVGDNATGIAGICWSVKIMAVRALGPTGDGSTSNVVSAIDFAVANGAKVINLSLGAPGPNTPLADAVADAEAADVVVVSAAGNEARDNDTTPVAPCEAGGTSSLCVAALTQNFGLASFSNYGATTVDIGAPGVNVVSSWNGAVTRLSPSMTTGWTFVNAGVAPRIWGYATGNFVGGGTIDLLVNPTNFLNGAANPSYGANSTDRVYRALDAGSSDVAVLEWTNAVDTFGTDFLRVRCADAGGDPFPGGTLFYSDSAQDGTALSSAVVEVPSACRTSTATFGFQMESDAMNQRRGLAIGEVLLQKTALDTTSFAVISGTSQATPFVSGVAALVRAYRPTATAARVVEAIKNGGRSVTALSGRTVTGRAVHALGALSYLAAPTGVSAELVAP